MFLGWIQLRGNCTLASSSFHYLGPDYLGSQPDGERLAVVWACVAADRTLDLDDLIVDHILPTHANFLLRAVFQNEESGPPDLKNMIGPGVDCGNGIVLEIDGL